MTTATEFVAQLLDAVAAGETTPEAALAAATARFDQAEARVQDAAQSPEPLRVYLETIEEVLALRTLRAHLFLDRERIAMVETIGVAVTALLHLAELMLDRGDERAADVILEARRVVVQPVP